jgi:hypothetical protein
MIAHVPFQNRCRHRVVDVVLDFLMASLHCHVSVNAMIAALATPRQVIR